MNGVLSIDERGGNGVMSMSQGRVRREVVRSRLMWSVVGVESRIRRGFRCPARGYVDEQSIVDSLTVGVIGVYDLGYGLVGLQWPACLLFPVTYSQGQVRGIVLAAQRISVFPENLLPDIIDKIFLVDGDQGSRGQGSFDPDLPDDHAGQGIL